ncbi:Amino acid kinase [Planctomycetales bacterium 10988]|nr:Amino acid kinase [Planctomycetales bacterium 10988]
MNPPPTRSLRVLKLGGSLFDLPSLSERISAWMASQPRACHLLVPGGGALADVIRSWDQTHTFDQRLAHQLAWQTMTLSSQFIRDCCPGSTLLSAEFFKDADHPLQEIVNFSPDSLSIIDTYSFYQAEGGTGPFSSLPNSWEVTSDSIAAILAQELHAEELVLFKSSLPVSGTTPTDWATAEIVDTYLPRIAPHLPKIRLVNLRDLHFEERTWLNESILKSKK